MLLHLIRDCSCSHAVDKIELVSGHRIESCLINGAECGRATGKHIAGLKLPEHHGSSFILVREEEDIDDNHTNFGIWFVIYLLDWVSINCSARQIEWCFYGREPSSIKYLEDEEYNINMDELFDSTQRLIECMSDDQYTNIERHESLVQILYHQVLPLITISQQDTELLHKATETQLNAINKLDKDLEMWNNTGTAFKSTLSNLQEKLIPDLLRYPQLRALYPDITEIIITRIEQHQNKLKRVTLTPVVRQQMEEQNKIIKALQKRRKSVSGQWKRKHAELLNELTIVCEAFQSATDELRKVKKMEGLLLSGKIKATQVKEEIRNVTHRLASQPETYGYDVPSRIYKNTINHSHHSLHNAVLSIIQNVEEEVGRKHLLETSWIIEQCELTKLQWQEDPSLIPSAVDQLYDLTQDDFLLVSEPDIFTLILEKISTQSAYTVGWLLNLLPRIKPSPASTKRLILTYENIIYERITPYILPLLELRYKSILDNLNDDVRRLTWEEFDIEEEWVLKLLHTPVEDGNKQQPIKSDLTKPPPINPNQTISQPMNLDHAAHQPITSHLVETTATSNASETINVPQPFNSLKVNSTESGSLIEASQVVDDLGLERNPPRAAAQSSPPGYSDSGYHEVLSTSPIVEESAHQIQSESLSQQTADGGAGLIGDNQHETLTTRTSSANSSRLNLRLELTSVASLEIDDSNVTKESEEASQRTQESSHRESRDGSEELSVLSSNIPSDLLHDSVASDLITSDTIDSSKDDNRTESPMQSKGEEKQLTNQGQDEQQTSNQNLIAENLTNDVENNTSAELDDLLDEALNTLDDPMEADSELNDDIKPAFKRLSRRTSSARSIQRPSSTEPSSSSQPSKPLTKPGRSKSVGAKVKTSARSRDTAVRATDGIIHTYLKQPGTPGTPQSPLPSPRIRELQARTMKDVESVVSRRRSRRFKSRRGNRTTSSQPINTPSTPQQANQSVAIAGANQFTVMFADSVQCLIDMETKPSPLGKAQMLAKCLRCMSTTISDIRTQGYAATSSDDLVTVAIVLLLNIPPPDFRSIYIQLKFISTYMVEFMDAGIHNFACVQFIGAMHFIQDQILTRKFKTQPAESRC